jgi:hypothetical protein
MKKQSKIVQRAIELKAQGYTHIASLVGSCYYTRYYHVVSIEDILSTGKWIPAPYGQIPGSNAHGRIGINGNIIDWTKVAHK